MIARRGPRCRGLPARARGPARHRLERLPEPVDARDYGVGAQILADLGVRRMRLTHQQSCQADRAGGLRSRGRRDSGCRSRLAAPTRRRPADAGRAGIPQSRWFLPVDGSHRGHDEPHRSLGSAFRARVFAQRRLHRHLHAERGGRRDRRRRVRLQVRARPRRQGRAHRRTVLVRCGVHRHGPGFRRHSC